MSNTQTSKPTKITTGKVRFSYANVWEPKQMLQDGKPVGEPKYSVSLLIPKKDKAQIKKIEAAIQAALELGIAQTWKGKKPANLKMPLHDGDDKFNEDDQKYAAYEGMMYITASSKSAPKIVNAKVEAILERDEFYSGAWGKASINFFPYDNVSKGIGTNLNNLQKLEDGENLGGGRSNPEDDFEVEDDDV